MQDFNFDFNSDDDFTFDVESNDVEPVIEPTSKATISEAVTERVEITSVDDMSDAEVDEAFDDLTNMLKNDESVLSAAAAIIEAESIVTAVEIKIADAKKAYDELTEQRAALEKQLNDIISKQREAHNIAQQFRYDKTAAERNVESAIRAKSVAENAIRVKYERQQQSRSFLEIAADKAWWNGIEFENESLKIMDHQWTGAQFLATAHGAILGDGMGLGKSLTSIAAMDLVNAKKILILAQADITHNFDNEVRMWGPHRPVVNIKGMTKAQRTQMLQMSNMMDSLVVIVNYEAWRKDLSLIEHLISVGFDTIIVDEAHNIKTTDTDAYKGVKAIALANNVCPTCRDIMPALIDADGKPLKGAQRQCVRCNWNGQSYTMPDEVTKEERYYWTKSVKNVWMVTGTPILNKPQDLFALLSLIDPLNFYRLTDYLRDYCEQDFYTGKWKFRSGGAFSLLNHRLNGRYLARTMEDAGIILPPQKPIIHDIDHDLLVTNYEKQYEVIQQITDHGMIVMNSGAKLPMMAQIAIITRQRQANVWPGGISWTEIDENGRERLVKVSEDVQESIKMDRAIELICEAVDEGRRVVLFSQFKSALKELQARLNGMVTEGDNTISSVRFDGDTPDHLREQIKRNWDKKFNEPALWNVLLANYRVGGVGLNLTQATVTIILDEEWNPGKRDQSYARTRRLGQKETTFVHVLRLERTVDTWLSRLIYEKENMIGGFNADASSMQEAWLKAFKEGELK